MVTPSPRLIAVRRGAVDPGSVLAAVVTVLTVCALVSGVVASLPTLQRQALRAAMQEQPVDDVVIEVVSSYDADTAEQQDSGVREMLAPVTAAAAGRVVRVVETVGHEEQAEGAVWSFLAVSGGGAPAAAVAVAGRLPTADGADGADGVVEVAVPVTAADAPPLGTRMTLVSPVDGRRVRTLVVGTWEPAAGSAPAVGQPPGSSLLVADGDLGSVAGRASSVRWRAAPDTDRLRPDELDDLRDAAAAVDQDVAAVAESVGSSLRLENPLVAVVEARARELTAQRLLFLVPALMLLLLGAAAAVMVAAALADNRRPDELLLRSRGADRRQLVGPTALEALVICALGAAVGPPLAAALVRIGGVRPTLEPFAWAAGLVAAAVCWVALVLPVVAGALGGDRGEQLSVERRRRRVLTSLFALVLLMVAFGVVAVVALDGFAEVLADSGAGAVDPLVVAAPSLLLLSAVTVLTLLLLPVLFRVTERAVRTRGVVLALGTRAVSRAPAKAVPLSLVVALVAGGIAFAAVGHASQVAAREARASYDVGADIRVTAPPPSLRAGVADERDELAGLRGVRDVSGVHRELDFIGDAPAELLVADLGGQVGRELVAASGDIGPALGRLLAGDRATDAVPVAVTEQLVDAAALEVGSRFELAIGDAVTTLEVAVVLADVPTVTAGRAGLLVDKAALLAVAPSASTLTTDEWWLSVEPAEVDAVAAALGARPGLAAETVTRAEALRRLAADPGTGGRALSDVMTVTVVGSLLVGIVLLSAVVVLRRRERDEQAAALRAFGASEADITLTLATEYTVTAGGGIVAGTIAGVLTAGVALHATSLGPGGQPLVPAAELNVPWSWMLPLLGLLLAVPMVALQAATRPGARRRLRAGGGRP
ncbi:MAG TPA: FtsX-like permease family protein [Nocardioidaceae bacterium]|nr:FtsX-like permease family protein [Nocardioidaceae bacterium]